ncbi:MAG: DUF1592 domain-containing protein [Chitinophagaceae bacterium]|nr:DUF1592 domain-containing protein [Oligoflexus sp.]
MMNHSIKILGGLILFGLSIGCKPPSKPGSFRTTHGGGGGSKATSSPGSTSSGDETVATNPGKAVIGGADLNLTRDTLSKIMQPPGGEQDTACSGKSLSSKNQLRLLTQNEYQNTVKDILGIMSDYRTNLPSDGIVFGFSNNADSGTVNDDHASAYLEVSLAIAAEVKSKLPTLVNCDESTGLVCAQKVIDTLAPQLWRRPIEDSEKTALLDVYKIGLASSPKDGITMLLSNLLIAPDFLYRMEIGKNKALNAYELASALSYFFWGTSPDATLQSLAASGDILKDATLLAQATRLLADARSKFTTAEFARGWIETNAILDDEKNVVAFPLFTDSIKNSMAAEAKNTFDYITKQPTSTFETLFTADYTLGPAALATYYKGQSVTEGAVTKIKFADTPRRGILGLGSILAHNSSPAETHPIMRGNFVLEKLFCHISPSTPKGLNPEIPAASSTLTTRERFAVHTSNEACAGCHIPIDGIGFGMEDFDGAGLYREMDNGKKVDTSGEVVGIDNLTTKFNGVGELSNYISKSSAAKRCFVVEWYRFAHGYAERPADICAIRDIANKFEKGSMTLPQLLINIVTHPSYAKRE